MHLPIRSGPPRASACADARRRRRAGRGLFAAALSLALAVLPGRLHAQGEITGTVVETGSQRPVAGAQVSVQGQTRSAITDAEGRFRLAGVSGSSVTLQVDRLGYARATRTVSVGDTNVRIAIGTAALALDALVVTGTPGGAEKRTLGNAVTTIDAAEVVRTQPVGSVQELLNARTPGVVVIPATGNVGTGSRIRVRGVGSLSLAQEPLVYVDGVRVNNQAATGPINQGFGSNSISRFNDINPEDIESIEVIRGPAAATLYGTEASNGVIQIITKRGVAGNTHWDFSMRQGALWFANADSRVWTNYGTRAGGVIDSIDIVELEESNGRSIWQTGSVQSYNLSVSGGSASVRYYVGGGLDRDEGVEANNTLRRWNARVNLTAEPRSDLDIRASAGFVSGRTHLPLEAGGGGTAWTSFFANPANLDPLADGSANPRRGFHSATPEGYRYAYQDWQDLDRFTGSMEISHRPAGWLQHRLAMGLDLTREDNVELVERMDDPRYTFFFTQGEIRGYRDEITRGTTFNSVDYSATASFSPSARMSSSTTLGAQMFRRYFEFVYAVGRDFPVRGLRAVAAAATREGSQNYEEDVTVGVFGQQQFGWNDRVFVTAALRADDNSAFGENFDLVYYPKLSASWVVSEEPFFGRFGWVDALKLRAAYGESGQQPVYNASLRTYSVVPGPGDVSAVTPNLVGNPDLGPERGKEVEMGFDAGFLDNRVGLEFTWYNKRTEDAILLRDIAPSTGFSGQQYFNAGTILNRGIEVLLRGTAVQRRNVELELVLNLATNHNEITDLGIPGLDTVQSGTYVRHVEGFPAGSWWEKKVVSATFDAAGKLVTGSEQCEDGNGGTMACATAPRLFLGRPTPNREIGFMPTLTLFNRLRISALVDRKTGYHKLDGNLRVRCLLFLRCRENFYPLEFVADDPGWMAEVQRGGTFVNHIIKDASFTRWRELSATYTVPSSWAARVGAGSASISIAGRNLYTWTNYGGMEPEASFLGGSRGGGSAQWEQNVTPQLQQFVTTINLSF
ncbi:MAG TPA: SusC/RagA family TonB-linked outer membrane protein [Longimicrobium sp.]|nr:SusC/RagA family TonB-linked outer membrane protein [Longimicrobium sp.]